MKILTSIVDLESIQVKSSQFNPENNTEKIEALANTIIDLGGLVHIPVVQEKGVDKYELISGYMEYYAYLKACEINPRLPDRITVFVADKKNQAAIFHQLEILQIIENTGHFSSQAITQNSSEVNLQIKNLESSIKNNNQFFSRMLEELKYELLAAIDAKLPKPIPLMDAFNRISEPEISVMVHRKLEFMGHKKNQKIVAKLQEISKQRKDKPFESFAEILDLLKVKQGNKTVRLISEEKMLAIIDRWNY
jgi:hypothetical protein